MDSRQKAHKSPKGAKTALFFACLASFFSLTLGIGGVTLAAYLNAVEAKENAILDFKDLSDYFFSVEENEGERVFHLNDETHLQNLQRLVSIGLFGPSDTFVLDKDIACTGTLYPIGTDDMPFDSAFNGNGHVISNLHVICADGRDAGLFGYTSINSSVKNLILSAPKIEVTANSINDPNDPNDGDRISGSPIEATYGPLADLMPEINFVSQDNAAAAGMINVTNGTQSGQTAVITGFPDSLSSGEAEVEILYESSDENLLTLTQTANGYQAECNPNPESNAPNFDLYPVTVDAKAQYEVNGVFGYYVLERYQFNILGNGNISTAVTEIDDPSTVDENGKPAKITVHSGAFKTIHPDYDEHNLNVGFFIGHCDGSANHLGLYGGNTNSAGQNGTIVINSDSRESAYSARTLIGKTRKDNPVDASAGDTMNIIYDYRGAINGTPDEDGLIHDFKLKVKDYEYGHDNFGRGYGFGSSISDYSNNGSPDQPVFDSDSAAQQDNAETMTENVVTNPSMREYSSFYPGSNKTLADSTVEAYKPSSSNWELGEYSDNADTAEPDPGSFNAQVIDGGLGAGTWTKLNEFIGQYRFLWTDYIYHHQLRLTRGYNINNGFKIWSTKDLSPIFTENLFYINFHVSYVATRDEETDANQNSFQLLFNSYNPEVRGYDKFSLGGIFDYNPYPEEWTSSYLQYLFWQDLSNPLNVDFSDGGQLNTLYNPADHPIIDDGELHSDVITLTIDQQNGTFWSNVFQSIRDWWDDLWNGGSNEQTESREARYPMFALGMGSNVGPNGGVYASDDHQSTANYYADLLYGSQETYQNSRFADSAVSGSTIADLRGTRLFDSDDGAYQTYDPSGSGEEGWVGQAFSGGNHYNDSVRGYYNNQERGYFNSYFEVENGTKLYIRDFQITFTNRLGNTEDIIYKVDFVPNTDLGFDENSQTWNAWPDDSNVQIGFNYDMKNTDGDVNFRFYRDNSNNVYGYYSNAGCQLVNSGEYDDAILAQG